MEKRVEICPQVLVLWALMLLVLPLRWLLGAMTAATVHEAFHWVAICLCGCKVLGIRMDGAGIRMETDIMEPWQELICALAGPLGSFVVLLFAKWFPVVALCAFVHGIFNLIPVFPMDGGRMLRSAVVVLAPRRGEGILRVLEPGVKICLLLGLFLGIVWLKIGWIWGVLFLTLLARMGTSEKYLAKNRNKGYNRDRLN